MWATFPMLREALDVIEAWGFSYKTVAFNWVKQNRNGTGIFMGLGNWTRSNSEICRSYDPIDLCFLELNELMMKRLIESRKEDDPNGKG